MKKIFKKIILHQMRQYFFWIAAIFVGRSERGNKQNFILGLIRVFYFLHFTSMPLSTSLVSLSTDFIGFHVFQRGYHVSITPQIPGEGRGLGHTPFPFYIVAVDLQLSIKVFGTDGLRAAGRVMYKTFDLRTAVCGHYNAKLLHCQLINLIPKKSPTYFTT
jgi:hypothetical protein